MKEKSNPIFIIDSAVMNNPQQSQTHIERYPLHTGELAPEKLRSLYEKNSSVLPLSKADRNRFEKEWEELSSKKEVLRIWEDGVIVSVGEDYYDDYIIDTVRNLHEQSNNRDFMKSARVIGELIGTINQYIGQHYYEYRVRHLIMNGVLEIEGVPKAM